MKKRLIFIFIFIFFITAAAGFARADQDRTSESPASYLENFLPGPDQIPGFSIQDQPARFTRDKLSEYLGDQAGPLLPYGLIEILNVHYGTGAQRPAFELVIYGFLEARGAYGVFAMERPVEAEEASFGSRSYGTQNSIQFHQGRYYVKIRLHEPAAPVKEGAATCASVVAEKMPGEPGAPVEFMDFPVKHAVPYSDRYRPVRYLESDFLFEVLTRDYTNRNEQWQAFLTLTPREEEGLSVFSTLRNFIGQKLEMTQAALKDADEAWTGRGEPYGKILILRKGRQIAGLVGSYPPSFPQAFTSRMPAEETSMMSIYFREEKVGEEMFHLARNHQGRVIRSSSLSFLNVEGNILAFEQHLQNRADGRPLSEYRLTAVENNRRTVFSVRPAETGLRISSSDGFNRFEKELPLPDRMIILDNLLANHYQLLLEQYDFSKKGEQRFTAFVPQSFAQVPLDVRWDGSTDATRNGSKIKADRLTVSSPNLLISAWTGPERRLLQLEVPAQSYRFLRNGVTIEEIESPLPSYLSAGGVKEEKVSFPSGKIYLKGAVTYPAGNRDELPAVVLIGGSGPLDRDGSIGPNRPFRDLAYGLSSRNMVVLRYDKKSFSMPESFDPFSATIREDIMEDGMAALRYLKGRGDVDNERIHLLGHSLGATAVCLIVKEEPVSGGVVLVTPHARTLDQLILDQTAFIMKNSGISESEIIKEIEGVKAGFEKIRQGNFPDKTLFLSLGPQYWQDILQKNVLEEIQNLKRPFLIIHGGKDYQVTGKEYDLFKKTMEEKRISLGRIELYPDLNHYLIPIEGTPSPRDYGIEGYAGEKAIKNIADFILSPGA